MSDLTDNQVLLRLIIKGMDPDEVKRLSDETYGQLKTEAAQHIDALTAYAKQAADAQAKIAKDSTDAQAQADADAIDEKIKGETRALDAVTKLMRQQEIEANKARGAWHGIMEDLENITTVATAGFKIMSEGFERLKSAAEEIIKDTNIYNSLTGSIEQMRVATDGTVANIDLISAKNRAFEKDLKLTDEEFGVASAQATRFAHSIGVDTKEALDKLIDGLATGNLKMLSHAGIMKEDLVDANQKWADKMGLTVDGMTEQDKLLATQAAAMEAMRKKSEEAGEEVDTLALHFERGFVRIKNAITGTAAAIGNIHVSAILDPSSDEMAKDFAAAREAKKKADKAISDRINAEYDKTEADSADDNATSNPDYIPGVGTNQAEIDARGKMKMGDKKGDAAEKARVAGAKSYDSFIDKLGSAQGPKDVSKLNPDDDLESKASLFAESGGTDDYVKAMDAANEADEKRLVIMEKTKGITVDTAVAYQKLAASLGVDATALDHDEKMQALNNEAMVQADKLAVEAKKKADARRAELKATKDKAGFMGIFLWGTGGPEETYKQMDAASQYMTDTMGTMSKEVEGAAGKMASAMGASIAAQISGDNAQRKSIKQTTHDVLEALATMGIEKAIFATGEGLLALATGPIGGVSAGTFFAAAAEFGALGISAGIAARAFNPSTAAPAGASAPPKANSGISSSSSKSSFGSGSSSSANDNSQAPQPVTFNMMVMPGGEPEAGRAVKRALDSLNAQTGQPLLVSHT